MSTATKAEDSSTTKSAGQIWPGGVEKVSPFEKSSSEDLEQWLTHATLVVVVVGASGDLAKKKTYPSLLNLYDSNLLPKNTIVYGYARSQMTDEELRERLRPFLLKTQHMPQVVERFLSRCFYHGGKSYGDLDAFEQLKNKMQEFEETWCADGFCHRSNRLFYFAIPPNVFAETALAIKQKAMQDERKGWSRLIVEKPFGRDLESFEELNATLSQHFTEDHLFRIDHYLGKEMVQNLTVLRFSNIWFERVWNSQNIQCVIFTFKEPFGTEGRGGYFDKFGIIRDILQNHLLQVLTLLAMETPTILEGPAASKAIRDAKVAVLNAIQPIRQQDVVLGQYEGYSEDPTIENKDTNTPTFATIRLFINTPRWSGVPFIMKAGKALNERKAEMRIQFKDAPAADYLFNGTDTPRNELVMRMQPHEAVYMKTNVKSPGFTAKPVQSELEVNYDTRFFAHQKGANPDAYTRLILDVLQGKHAAFVRDDELRRAWEIFTPILHQIEKEKLSPIVYPQGSRGPAESDAFIQAQGYVRNEDYVFYEGTVARKSEGTNVQKLPSKTKEEKKTYSDEELCDVGLFVHGEIGQNLAVTMAQKGIKVCVGSKSSAEVERSLKRAEVKSTTAVVGAEDPEDLVARLSKPRKIIVLVGTGKSVDDALTPLARYMEAGDVIVDGGDEWFPNSIRRSEFLETRGIHFAEMGISGGEEGACRDVTLMVGGSETAHSAIEPILSEFAVRVERVGPAGSGNYLKMVYNGMEDANMQLVAEAYDILKNVLGVTNEEMADVFDEWNKEELGSSLIEVTSKILRQKEDDSNDGFVVDNILDKPVENGNALWVIQEAAEKGVAIPTISAALDVRILSAQKDERVEAEKILPGPASFSEIEKPQVLSDLYAALYASKVCSCAQGLNLIRAASDEHKWGMDLSACARLLAGGSLLRARLLDRVQEALARNPALPNLLVDQDFSSQFNEKSAAWRRVLALSVMSGISCPSLSSSLTYFDTYRRGRLPGNLNQAHRNFFLGHAYERTDKEGRFHTGWTDGHKDTADAKATSSLLRPSSL